MKTKTLNNIKFAIIFATIMGMMIFSLVSCSQEEKELQMWINDHECPILCTEITNQWDERMGYKLKDANGKYFRTDVRRTMPDIIFCEDKLAYLN